MLSPSTFTVLRRLASGEVLSARAIADAAAVPQHRVRQAIDEALAQGIRIDALRGRGYRLGEPLAFIDPTRVAERLGPFASRVRVRVLDATGSTNSDLVERADLESIDGQALVAELQTAGRGRGGVIWKAALGGSLTFSLGWSFALPVSALSGLPLGVGVAVARALAALGIPGIQLKWPNDIVWKFQKLGGVLVETLSPSPGGTTTAVIGVGLNVRLPDSVRDDIPQAVTDLGRIGAGYVDRSALLGETLRALVEMLDAFARDGLAAVRADWGRLHAYDRRAVSLRGPGGRSLDGTIVGIDDDGALLLERGGAVERVLAGDMSLRV